MSSTKDHLHVFEGSEYSENKVKLESNFSMSHVPSFVSLVQPLSGEKFLKDPNLHLAHAVQCSPKSSQPLHLHRPSAIPEMSSSPRPSSSRRYGPSDPDKQNDPLYLERRRKNNEAARKSREAKKQRVVDNVKLITELETENRTLRSMIAVENEHIRILEQSVRSVVGMKQGQGTQSSDQKTGDTNS